MAAWVSIAAIFWLIANAGLDLFAQEPVPSRHHVPAGFVIEKVAAEPQIKFPMFGAFDDRGGLFVAESSGLDLYKEITAGTRKCQVRLLQDRDGDGRFETSGVFADKLVFPMGLVWRERKLYVADPPDLVALEDVDEDGRADRRTVVLTGFGHKDNGSLHGLIFGPDGLLYMTMGEPDGYRLKRADGSILEGNSGALIRCRPDGSEVEVLCRGFENLVEVVFTATGEIIGTDNWYQQPVGGVRDALLHLIEGGLYPMYPDNGSPKPITGEPLPALSLFPAVALSGLVLYRGGSFPAAMLLFSAQHNTRKVGRHLLSRHGSTFQSQDEDFVTSDDPDFHPSDVLEDADGTLLVLDTGSWYTQHCPTGRIRTSPATGGIYRVRRKGSAKINDPWGLNIPWTKSSIKDLAALLADPRPIIRDRAQQNLSARGKAAVPELAVLLANSKDLTSRLHAIWALAGIDDERALIPLRRALESGMPEVTETAARALGLRKDRTSAPALARMTANDTTPLPVRLAAAEALAHCGEAHSLPLLWRALSQKPDRFLEHALIHAAHWLADERELLAALEHPVPVVQKAALLLLDQPPRPPSALQPEMVLKHIAATNAGLRQTALKVLQKHPAWSKHAVALTRVWLEKPNLNEEEKAGLRALMETFKSEPALQDVIGNALGTAGDSTRLFVLETLAETGIGPASLSLSREMGRAIEKTQPPAIRLQAVRTAGAIQLSSLDPALLAIANDTDQPSGLRLEALRATIARRPKLTPRSFDFLASRLAGSNDPLTRLAASEVLRKSHLTDAQLLRALKTLRGQSLISPSTLLPALRETTESAAALLDYLVDLSREGWKPSEDQLTEILERLPAELRDKARPLRERLRRDPEEQHARLAKFEPLLRGGMAERGRTVFFGNKVACSTCHAIGPVGGKVGPDLTKIGVIRSGRDILESILLPSSTFAQGYESYSITTATGELSGVLVRQSSDAVVLRDASGAEWPLRRSQVTDMRQQKISIMPEGLEAGLTDEEFRDLLAFLQSLK